MRDLERKRGRKNERMTLKKRKRFGSEKNCEKERTRGNNTSLRKVMKSQAEE